MLDKENPYGLKKTNTFLFNVRKLKDVKIKINDNVLLDNCHRFEKK